MTRRLGAVSVLVASACLFVAACSDSGTSASSTTSRRATTTTAAPADGLRLNQVQLIGSHNSYHIAPEPRLLASIESFAAKSPSIAKGLGDPATLAYTHAPLDIQLDRGARTFELDVYNDPQGGLFAKPLGPSVLGVTDPVMPQNMDKPGIKVMHIVDIDYITTCEPFIACLTTLKTWSDAHPDHLPLMIDIELENAGLPQPVDFTKVVPFGAAQMDALDAEVRSVFTEKDLITPDWVRGSAGDLNSAVTKNGWPTLKQSRGRLLFFMDNTDASVATYLEGHPSLRGRVMFTSSTEGQPESAVVKVNDPTQQDQIRRLVKAGYLVRTRADSDLTASTTERDQAFASGAQDISTDYPPGEPRASDGYVVTFGSAVAGRCNPIDTTPTTCSAADVAER